MPETVRDRYVLSTRQQWHDLVRLALRMPPEQLDAVVDEVSRRTGGTQAILRRKLQAIQHARASGLQEAAIVATGQGPVLSKYAAHRNGKAEKQRFLRWRVSSELADAVQTLQERIMKVCGIRTSEDLWMFFHSNYADLTDVELRNLADGRTEKKRR